MSVNPETVKNFVLVHRARNNMYWADIYCKHCKTLLASSGQFDTFQKVIDKYKQLVKDFEIEWLFHLLSCTQYQEKNK